jgi:hypothetical protein
MSAADRALAEYARALDSGIPLRGITLDIKFKNDSIEVRAVVVTLQGELTS